MATRAEVGERIKEALVADSEDLRDRGRSMRAPRDAAGTIAADRSRVVLGHPYA